MVPSKQLKASRSRREVEGKKAWDDVSHGMEREDIELAGGHARS